MSQAHWRTGADPMSRIGYLAFMCADPAALAGFYRHCFGMAEIGRNAAGDCTLTDGGFNLTLFKQRPQLHEPRMECGPHHLGIAVESLDQTLARYRAFNPRGVVIPESGDLQHGEVRIHDPECNPVSLSQRQFGLTAVPGKIPRIAHIALNALDTELVRDFYRDVLGFRELFEAHRESRKRPGYRNKHVGDGHSNVAIQTFYSDEVGHEARFGIAHFGFLVGDSKAMAAKVAGAGATVKARPAHRTQSEIRMRDPEGNGCDLSQRGWEVDTDKWVRAGAA
jgi:catechol 2,3-dioxygenase-like lactoylglutathione lyase family enzyme